MDASLDTSIDFYLSNKSLAVNRIEALRTLAALLLREVESLQPIKQNNEPGKLEKIDLANEVQQFEVDLIREALICSNGRQRQAAKLLSTKTSTLNAKIKRYGISFTK